MKSVVLCGSGKFKEQMYAFASALRGLGITVYTPFLYRNPEEWDKTPAHQQRFIAMGLTHDHFYKIRQADVVFIYNEGGYIGNSTTMEIGFSVACHKPIYALAPDTQELFRDVLFRDIVQKPEALRDILAA